MTLFQRSGYRSKDLFADLALGLSDGLDISLWCYVYASIIFAGALSVYLPVGILVILLGWVLVSLWVSLTSREPLHVCNPDDQAIVIFGAITALMVNAMGERAGTPAGLATVLFIIASTTLAFSACCYLAALYRFSRMLELMPFPVVCGFMAAIGWLLVDAGLEVMTGSHFSMSFFETLAESGRMPHLLLSVVLGALMLWLSYKLDRSWTLPAASLVLVICYYLVMAIIGMPMSEQADNGWLYVVEDSKGGATDMLASLSLSVIDWSFVASVIPHMLTILVLALLYASMSLTALKADSKESLSLQQEFRHLATGNLFAAAVCCPQGFTDSVSVSMYREFGATSRWMPLTSSFAGIIVIMFGATILGFLPKLLVGATIFLFVFQTFYDWMYANLRGFGWIDYVIVWIIFATAIIFGFMIGVLLGIILTVLLFVMRYSKISAIQSRHTLQEQRSSVERSRASNRVLKSEGGVAVIYRLRGFLFFGTANAILDTVVENEQIGGECRALLMDMSWVTGVDVSALNVFSQIKDICDHEGVQLLYSGVPGRIRDKLIRAGAVGEAEGRKLLFDQADYAIEHLETMILENSSIETESTSIHQYLLQLVGDDGKVGLLLQAMKRVECQPGETLFEQGANDDGFYLVESGAMSAFISNGAGKATRVRKFSPGSLIGELSAYLHDKHRTATVIADEHTVLYHLDTARISELQESDHEIRAVSRWYSTVCSSAMTVAVRCLSCK